MKDSRRLVSILSGIAVVAVVLGTIAVALPKLGRDGLSGSDVTSIASVLPLATPASTAVAEVSAGPTTGPCCSTTPPASPTPFDNRLLAESDLFWERWRVPIHVYLPHEATSLAEEFRIADLVVRGRIADLYIGEYWRGSRDEEPYPLAYIKIEVEEILKGEPASRTPGAVEVQIGVARADLEDIRARLPDHDNLWFLNGPEGYEGRDLAPQNESEIAPFAYVTTNDYQGVLREINGTVKLVQPEALAELFGPDHFPLPLDGTSFQLVLADVRTLAQLAEATPLAP